MEIYASYLLPGILFLLTLIFGFFVSRSGKPYNGILFTIHKLIALGAVVTAVIQLSRMRSAVDAVTLMVVLMVVAAICVAALFASGALMSMNRLDYIRMRTIHRIAPVVLLGAMAWLVYLLGKQMFP
ncbi:MAG: hypothetical protein ABFD44_04890 [Anaerolineaceae bacterium]